LTARDTQVCVLVKPPAPGRVKTRLAADIGSESAARLARAFLEDTCRTVSALTWASAALVVDGPPGLLPAGLVHWRQASGDLGVRIETALRRALALRPFAIAIGGDTPDLPAGLLRRARDALNDAEAVLAPSHDGGFSLLGLRRCPEGVLAGIPWSSKRTFEATRRALEARGLRTAVVDDWSDVDTFADLSRLRRAIAACRSSAPATQRAADELLPVPRVSVILPVLEEERRIGVQLDALRAEPRLEEVLVVDGGSRDRTFALASQRPGVRALVAPRGRATQMNAGARAAGGDVLLFLHADTRLPVPFLDWIALALRDPGTVMGAFRTTTIDDVGHATWSPLLRLADLRSRTTRRPYGDQALFLRSDAFWRAGGYPDQPLMEDLELSHRVAALGRIRTVRASVRVSGRRFLARPAYYTLAVNLFPLLYRLGVPAGWLARAYGNVR
jgi:uncharacterized protein